MAKKRFKVDILSPSSVTQLKNELTQYKNSLSYKSSELARLLAEAGVPVARMNVAELDAIFTGELISSIHSAYVSSKKFGAVFCIVADSKHAMYVEFGTGIVGRSSPYPYPFPPGVKWDYASGQTIRQLADGRYGWFYERDGQVYFTEGMPSRPFMYNTALDLVALVPKIAKGVFK